MNVKLMRAIALVCVAAGLSAGLWAQERPPIEIRTTHVAENVYMFAGAGGNLAVSVGDSGALLVDAEYGQLTEKVLAAVKELTDEPVRFVINTHWHFDHVGGNENLAKAGAVIVAHENVRQRMSSAQVLGGLGRKVPPSPAAALPVITFRDALTFHWNGDEVQIRHLVPAHTDGDSMIYFRKANVLHVADIWFNGMYPFIDVNAGGSIDGMIAAVDQALALANAETRIIPGHGALSDAAELRAYRKMLVTVRDQVQALVKAGKSREEAIAARPTKDLDAQWGTGGMPPDVFVGVVYDGMSKD